MTRSDYSPPTFTDVPQSQWGNPPAGAVALDAAHLNAMAQAISNSVPFSSTGRFDVKSYGAVGNGTTDDTAAFRAAITAAIAAQGTLVISPCTDHYVISSTLNLLPPGSSTQFGLNIEGSGSFSSIQWAGPSNTPVFHAAAWKLSHVDSVKIDFTSTTATGVIGWDLDTTSTFGSTTHVAFNECFVGLSSRVNSVGWRLGHNSGGGGDISFYTWTACMANGTLASGQRGWINEGGNTLNNAWINCLGYGLEKMVTNQSDTGAASAQGNDSMFFYSMGGSGNLTDFEFSAPGTYLISGGRFELGKRFLNITGPAANYPAVLVQGSNVSTYTPSDGKLVAFNRPGTLTWDSNYVYGPGVTFDSNLFSLGGFGAYGTLDVRGGAIQGTEPFYNGGSIWRVYSRGVAKLGSNTQSTGYFTDLPTTSGTTVPVTDSFTRADSTTSMGSTETGLDGSAPLAWTALTSTWGISGNQAYNAAGTSGGIAVVNSGAADHTIQAKVPVGDGGSAILARVTDANNWLGLLVAGAGALQVMRCVAGSVTSFAFIAAKAVAGDVFRLQLVGTSGYVYRNGILLSKFTDSSTGTKCGFRADSNAARFDEFVLNPT